MHVLLMVLLLCVEHPRLSYGCYGTDGSCGTEHGLAGGTIPGHNPAGQLISGVKLMHSLILRVDAAW